MADIRRATLPLVIHNQDSGVKRSENVSTNLNFSTAYEFARIKMQATLLIGTIAPQGANLPSKMLSFQQDPHQGEKASNALASLTGSEPSLHERALALRAYRQQILASNIANADTPNYKAIDIDIPSALKNGTPLAEVPIKYQTTSTPGVDGNTVDMDIERQKFAENSLMYEYQVDKVRGKYRSMSDLLQNLPY